MVEVATFFQVLVMIGGPIVLARAIVRHFEIAWRAVLVGAASFLLSQVGHLPFNWLVIPYLPAGSTAAGLAVVSVFVGLSAGCFEELARFVAMRWVLGAERTGAHALAFGAGHGGMESIAFGAIAALGFANVLVIEHVGVDQLGLDAEQLAQVSRGMSQFHAAGILPPILIAFERVCAVSFHLAASALVMRSVVERRAVWLVLAIGLHALSDGLLLPIGHAWGAYVTEMYVATTLPISLVVLAWAYRALPRLPRVSKEARPESTGAPIEVVRAEKRYGDVHALRGVSFTLKPGERACLLGPNGAGKTTTIRMITGAIAPTRGFVFVLGQTSADEGFLEKKRQVGIVPQQPGMYEHLTVRQYLALVRELYGRGDDPAVAAQKLGLEEVLDRATTALSGGMQRRLALAAALLPHPDVLVLDEPSAGLDPVASRQMIEAVRDASAQRTTLLCTHNLAEAEELCDSVIILRGGEVVVHSTIEALRAKVTGRVALRAHGGNDALLAALAKLGHGAETEDGEVRVVVAEPDRAAPAILRALLGEGVDVFECRVVKPSLEDLFFRAVETGSVTPSVPPAVREAEAKEAAP